MNSDNHYFSRLLRKNIWIYFFSFLIAPTGYIVKIVISNSVSVEELWVLYSVMSLMTILGSYNDVGMTESLNYFLPKFIHDKDAKKITNTFSIALCTQMVTSIVIAIGLYFFADFLASHYFESPQAEMILKILVLQFFADNIFRTIGTFFSAIQDTRLQKSMDFLRMFLLMCIVCGLWFFDMHTIEYYAWAWSSAIAFGSVVSLLFIVLKYHRYFTLSGWRFSFDEYKRIFKYAFWVMLSANVGMLLSQIDMQMVVYMLGTEAAGYYTNYLSLIRIPFLFLLPGVYFLFPVFSDLLKRGEERKVIAIHAFCYELFSIVAMMMTSFFILFGTTLTTTLFGPGYEMSGAILIYSAPFLLFNFLLQIDFQILSASGRPRTKMFILLAGVGLNLVTNYIFLKQWGVVGSAFASGIGWLFIWTLSFRQTRKFAASFRWPVFWENFVWIWLLTWALSTLHLEHFFEGRLALFGGIMGVISIYWLVFIALNWSEFRRFQRIFRSKHLIW
jgi:O-antigen/teichoic acid export membrane protein